MSVSTSVGGKAIVRTFPSITPVMDDPSISGGAMKSNQTSSESEVGIWREGAGGMGIVVM